MRDVGQAYEPDMSVMLPEMEPEMNGPLAEPERLYSRCIVMLLQR